MKYALGMLLVFTAVISTVHGQTTTAPKPAVVSMFWQLEFEFQTPELITVTPAGETKPQSFWYMLYTVTNKTGADQLFVPSFTLYTDTGQTVRAGVGVPTAVFEAIQKRHNKVLLMDAGSMTGKILQGEDNAKEGVAIWRNFDPGAHAFDIFVGGLSGERAKVQLPQPVTETVSDEQGNKKEITKSEVLLSKTLHLRYLMPSEATARGNNTPTLEKKEWVMR